MQKTCTCGFLHGAETSESLIQEVDKALEGQQEYQGQVCFYRKNGEEPRGLQFSTQSQPLLIFILFPPKTPRKCVLVPPGYCSNQKRER